MNVWRNWGADGYEWVMETGGPGKPALSDIFQLRQEGRWTGMRVDLIREDEGKRFNEADFPWRGSSLMVLRPRALTIIGDVLEQHGELLPLECNDAKLLAYNCTAVVDALDPDRSAIKRFQSSGRVMRIEHHVFVPERLGGIEIFRLPQFDKGGPIYFSDAFRQLVIDSGLTGLDFQLKWSTDPSLPVSDSW